jgi:hypothetical protein
MVRVMETLQGHGGNTGLVLTRQGLQQRLTLLTRRCVLTSSTVVQDSVVTLALLPTPTRHRPSVEVGQLCDMPGKWMDE